MNLIPKLKLNKLKKTIKKKKAPVIPSLQKEEENYNKEEPLFINK